MRDYLTFQTSNNFKSDIKEYFIKFHNEETYQHTLDVVEELYNIKGEYGFIEEGSETACYCHDLGRVVKYDEILDFCKKNHIEVTEEEKLLPSILHQKISRYIAEKVFNIKDKRILDAVRYHTTSRANPSVIEMEVFLADKMSWKEEGYKEIADEIRNVIKVSKENAMLYYLRDLNKNKESLKLYHLDSIKAFEYFKESYSHLT
ncbi:HD domain-containing protein [Clostridium sp. D2Q-11]|uniref:HD domain-containing protein n=1 Tax=Anaeromonas frigoriresistens TaxID=2683708 RepID=A0A942UU61_9FIRM|nr:HD domain-containing protein [Anaeromonas frigoriresistens]MBS4537520.1 HD domain-containing protein [Anaeromonas frigoriresistens]